MGDLRPPRPGLSLPGICHPSNASEEGRERTGLDIRAVFPDPLKDKGAGMAAEPPGLCSHSDQAEESITGQSSADVQRRWSHPQRAQSILYLLCLTLPHGDSHGFNPGGGVYTKNMACDSQTTSKIPGPLMGTVNSQAACTV
jgi:hypothetical protein